SFIAVLPLSVYTNRRLPSVRVFTMPKAALLKPKKSPSFLAFVAFTERDHPSTLKKATSSVTKISGSGTRDHLPNAPISVARGWMYSLRAFSSPVDTTFTTGDTVWIKAPEKSADPWWGTFRTSERRLI